MTLWINTSNSVNYMQHITHPITSIAERFVEGSDVIIVHEDLKK